MEHRDHFTLRFPASAAARVMDVVARTFRDRTGSRDALGVKDRSVRSQAGTPWEVTPLKVLCLKEKISVDAINAMLEDAAQGGWRATGACIAMRCRLHRQVKSWNLSAVHGAMRYALCAMR
eukprot:Skav217660  [mRNA]  locus=scaffold2919:110504:113227:+ [translate_table: standard]